MTPNTDLLVSVRAEHGLGPVRPQNIGPLVIEEYVETEQRYAFDDAIDSLSDDERKTILMLLVRAVQYPASDVVPLASAGRVIFESLCRAVAAHVNGRIDSYEFPERDEMDDVDDAYLDVKEGRL